MTAIPTPQAGSSPNARPVHLFEVPLPAPLNLDASLAFLRRSGDDLFERWDGHTLLRVLTVDDHRVPVAMSPLRDRPALVVAAAGRPGKPVSDDALRRVVMEQFITDEPAWQRLLAKDPVLARLDAEHPRIRPLRLTDPLYALVRSISAGHLGTPTEDHTRQLTGHWGPAALVAQQLMLEAALPVARSGRRRI